MIWTRYGPPEVLQLRDVEQPVPKDNQILVRVFAANVFLGDCELRRMDVAFPFSLLVRLGVGIFKPRAGARLGQEYAGEVVAVGKSVTRFSPGDRIFGAIEPFTPGCYAEYIVSTGKAAMKLPAHLPFEKAAAAAVGGLNALHFLRVAGVTEGGQPKKLLLIGAGGSIGTMAIQIARAFGAHVTAVDTTHKLQKLRDLGADRVIDYTREDVAREGEVYDATIDIVGGNARGSSLRRSLKTVKPDGLLILGNPPFRHLLALPFARLFTRKKVRFALASYGKRDCDELERLIQSGRVSPAIDRVYALEQAVDAHRYMETGQRIGNVVLAVSTSEPSV